MEERGRGGEAGAVSMSCLPFSGGYSVGDQDSGSQQEERSCLDLEDILKAELTYKKKGIGERRIKTYF